MARINMSYTRSAMHKLYVDALTEDGVACNSNSKNYNEQATYDAMDTGNRGLFNIYNNRINEYQDMLCALIGEKRINLTEAIPAIDFLHTENSGIMATYPVDSDGVVDSSVIKDIPYSKDTDVYNKILVAEDPYMVNRIAAGDTLSEYVYNTDVPNFSETYDLLVSGDLGETTKEYRGIYDPEKEEYITPTLYCSLQDEIYKLETGHCTVSFTLNDTFHFTSDGGYPDLSSPYIAHYKATDRKTYILTQETIGSHTRFAYLGNGVYRFNLTYEDHLLIAKPKSESSLGSTNFMIYTCETSATTGCFTEQSDGTYVDLQGNVYTVDSDTGYLKNKETEQLLDPNNLSSARSYIYYIIPFMGDELISWNKNEIDTIFETIKVKDTFSSSFNDSPGYLYLMDFFQVKEVHVADASGLLLGLYSKPYKSEHYSTGNYTLIDKWELLSDFSEKGMPVGVAYNDGHLLGKGNFFEAPLAIKDPVTGAERVTLPKGFNLKNDKGEVVSLSDYTGISTLVYDIVRQAAEEAINNCLIPYNEWVNWTNKETRMTSLNCVVTRDDYAMSYTWSPWVSPDSVMAHPKKFRGIDANPDSYVKDYIGLDPRQLDQYFQNCAPRILVRTEKFEYPTEEFYYQFVRNKGEVKGIDTTFWKNYFGWDPNRADTGIKKKFPTSGLFTGRKLLSRQMSESGEIYPEVIQVPKEVTILSINVNSDVNCSYDARSSVQTDLPSQSNHPFYSVVYSGAMFDKGHSASILETDYMKTIHVDFKAYFLEGPNPVSFMDSWRDFQGQDISPKLNSVKINKISVMSPLEAFQKKGHNDDTILVYPTNKEYMPEKLYLLSRKDIGLEEKNIKPKDGETVDSVDTAINPKSIVNFFSTDGQGKVITFVTTKKTEFNLSNVDYVELTGTLDVTRKYEISFAPTTTRNETLPLYALVPYKFGTEHDCYIYELEPFNLAGVKKGLNLSDVKVVDPFGKERDLFEGLSSLKLMPFAYPKTYFQTEKKTNMLNSIVYSISPDSQTKDFQTLQNSVIVPGIPKPSVEKDWTGLKCYGRIPIDSFTGLMSGVPFEMIIQKSLKSALASWPLTDNRNSYLNIQSLPSMLDGLMKTVRHLLNMAGENLEISYRNSSTGILEKHILTKDDIKYLSERSNYTQDILYTLPENLTRSFYIRGTNTPTNTSDPVEYLNGFGNEVKQPDTPGNQLKLSSFLKVRNLTQGMFGENETIDREECQTLDALLGNGTFPFLSFGDVDSPMDSYVRSFRTQVVNVLAPQLQSYNEKQEEKMRSELQAAINKATETYMGNMQKANQHNKDTVAAYKSVYSYILEGCSISYNESEKKLAGNLCTDISVNQWSGSFVDFSKIRLRKSAFMNDPYLSSRLTQLKNSFSYKVLWWWVTPYSGWSNSTFWDYFDFGTTSDSIGPASWRLLERSRWNSTFYSGLKSILNDYIKNCAANYAPQGIEISTVPPTMANADVKLSLFQYDGKGYNIPLPNAFAGIGIDLSPSMNFAPDYTVSQMKDFLWNDTLSVFRYQKPVEGADGTSDPAYNVYLPVLTSWNRNQYQVKIEVAGQENPVYTVLEEGSDVSYISDLTSIQGDKYLSISGVKFTNFNDMDPALFSGLVTFMKSALDGTTSSNDTGSNPGVLNTKKDKGPLGRVNSLYYQRYQVLNSRLNLANGTLTRAYNMLRNAQNVEETETYTQNNVSTFQRIMAVIPVEKMTPMTFLPAQDSQSGQVRMNSKFYYTEFMEAIRSSISDKCVLTCTHCNVKDSCPFYNEEEVLKLYVPQADSIDLWLKDNELDLLWDVEDEDIVLTADIGDGNEKHLYADTFRNLHRPYAEVVKHIGTGSQNAEEYDVNPLNDVKDNLSRVGVDFEKYNSDGMGWLLGGRYGTLQHNSVKSIPVEGYDESKFPDYRYMYDALFIQDQESYIKYSKSSDAYHVSLDYQGDHYEGDVHIKMPIGVKFPGGITPKEQDDIYLVSDDLVDAQGNEMTPVIYLNTVGNLLFYFDMNTSSDTSSSAEASVQSASSEITVSSVDGFDAAGNYVPAGSMSPVVSRVPRSSNDHIMYPKDVAQWCVNYAKGPCYDTPLSADDPQNKDQFWMENLKKKCSYQGSSYWIDVAGRPRMSSGYSENTISTEEEVNPYLVISGKPVVNSYVNFVRRLSLKLEDWVRDGDPQYVSDYDNCSIKWVKNPGSVSEIERQRYVLTQMKTNLRLVLVRNG